LFEQFNLWQQQKRRDTDDQHSGEGEDTESINSRSSDESNSSGS